MKRSPKTNIALVAIGLILMLSLFFANKIITKPGSQTAVDTLSTAISPSPDVGITATYIASLPKFPTPIDSDVSATPVIPTATSTLAPPQCTFPLAQTKYTESKLEEYTFSDLQVMLTAAQGNIYHIAEWLPDNQQVLITEELRNNSDGLESIELYNPEKDESQVYAIRTITHEPPSWNPKMNAVVYPVMNYFDIDKQAGTYKFTRQLWVSYGDPDAAKMLDDNLTQLPFTIKPGGDVLVYLLDKQLSKRDKSLQQLPPVLIDHAQWDYAKERRSNQPVSYKMIWQPGTSLIFLYSEGAVGGGGYTFILNADTGDICELDFGGWASQARWSLDGRYLAIGRVTKSHPTVLTLLDTTSGKLTILDGAPQEIEGQLLIYDFVWAPDNHHLLAIGSVISPRNSQAENDTQGLYLVDIASGQTIHIAPEHKSFVFSQDNNFAWSKDGSQLVIHCPTQTVDQICRISVQRAKS